MAVTCPDCGCTDLQTLADRYVCMDHGHYIAMDGTLDAPGLNWTSERPAGVFEDAPGGP